MRLKRKKRVGRRRSPRRFGWWGSLDTPRRRQIVRGGVKSLLVLAVLMTIAAGLSRLEAHVERQLVQHIDRPVLAFVDASPQVSELALDSLHAAVADLLEHDWIEEGLCHDIATRLGGSGWVEGVNFVRRTGDGRIEVSAKFRAPAAMVQYNGDFLLIDREGTRLPGKYRYVPTWKLIQGVEASVPPPGVPWRGSDLQAGLNIVRALAGEPFQHQITGVLVENVDGRVNPGFSHLELATDRAGGRIRWGSAPGMELEENTLQQKLAILRENYRRTGRIDAEHPIIDVSTFPDRYTIPG